MSRFSEAPEEIYGMMKQVMEEKALPYEGAQIKILMDSKKKKSKGKYCFASIKKANEKEKFLTADNINPDGCDYFLFIDENIFDNIDEEDKKRILYHELLHIERDVEKDDPWKLRDHEITGFHDEVDGDPDVFRAWDRVAEIAVSIYEEDK